MITSSNGENGTCNLSNKRGTWTVDIPAAVSVRKSDDVLKYDCKDTNGQTVVGSIKSTVGAKIVASAVFLNFGIVDAITDKHRNYPGNFVIPIAKQ